MKAFNFYYKIHSFTLLQRPLLLNTDADSNPVTGLGLILACFPRNFACFPRNFRKCQYNLFYKAIALTYQVNIMTDPLIFHDVIII